jgi:plastocyanin
MKKLLFLLAILSFSTAKATVHTIQVWDGYFQFLPADLTIELGDTIEWLPLDQPTMAHTITSSSIPNGAASFDEIWQAPADTFFRYIPQVIGQYDYVCAPHVGLGMIGSFTVQDTPVSTLPYEEEEIAIYPNPTSDYLYCNHVGNATKVELLDLSGRVISQLATQDAYFDLRHLSHGQYFVRFSYMGEAAKVFQIVVID